MEPNWVSTTVHTGPFASPSTDLLDGRQSHQGFYSYYPNNDLRSSDRPPVSSSHADPSAHTGPEDSYHRRSTTQSGSFLPPPPPHTASPHLNLPPFSQAFYSSYHPPSDGGGGGHQASTSAPANLHMGYVGGDGSASGGPMSAPPGSGGFNFTSPVHLPRSQPPYESPRIPGAPGGYSSSPGVRHLSPTSPTIHLAPPGISASSVTSSSSFASATRTPATFKSSAKPRTSDSPSGESWDETDRYGSGMTGCHELLDENDGQPWGMPQDEYKALNPKDKKQVRNRIGARRFRAKRKGYVIGVENSLREREAEVATLRAQVESHRNEINDLRSRLGMAMLSPPSPGVHPASGLGLLVTQSESWDEK